MLRRALPLTFLLFAACASMTPAGRDVVDLLYCGTAIPGGGTVSEAEWQQFLHDEVTPRFPGYTHWLAHGSWKDVPEETHVLQIVHPVNAEADAAVAAIAAAYQKRFRQEAVLRVRVAASMSL